MIQKKDTLNFLPCWFDIRSFEMRKIVNEVIEKRNDDSLDFPLITHDIDQEIPGCLRLIILANAWEETFQDFKW